MHAKDVLNIAGVIIDALPLLAKMTDVPVDKAAPALAGIKAAVESLIEGAHGKLSADEILERITVLQAQLQSNDVAADAALDAKFGK